MKKYLVKLNKTKTLVICYGKYGKKRAVAGTYNIESKKFTIYKKIRNRTLQNLKDYERAISKLLGYSVKLVEKPAFKKSRKWGSYKEYLKSDEWRIKRDKKLKEAENRCQVCYSPENLQVHHRTYNRIFRERQSDLTVLCRGCHETFHSQLWDDDKIEQEVNKLMQKEGYK